MSDIVERLGVLAASLANPQVAVDAQRELERLRAELAAARAESALQPNYSCKHDGCAMREDAGYQEQARKYVDDYYRMKNELDAAKALLREAHNSGPIHEHDDLNFPEERQRCPSCYFKYRIRAALGDYRE